MVLEQSCLKKNCKNVSLILNIFIFIQKPRKGRVFPKVLVKLFYKLLQHISSGDQLWSRIKKVCNINPIDIIPPPKEKISVVCSQLTKP